MQKRVSTLTGIVIIVAVVVILFSGVFAYQYYTKTNFKIQSPAVNIQKSNLRNGAIFIATPISGFTPLTVVLSGRIDSKIWGLGPIIIDSGEPQINYCSVGLTGTNSSTISDIDPEAYIYKTPGIYIAKLRVGKNCDFEGCIPCVPGQVISTSIITVK